MVHIKTPYCLITMKKVILGAITLFLAQNLSAQSLNKMQWFNAVSYTHLRAHETRIGISDGGV